MTKIVEPINEQAARWVVRADAGVLGPDEQRELDSWLNADPRHRGAYIRARAQWVNLDRIGALHGPTNSEATKVGKAFGISRRELLAASVATITIAGGASWIALRWGTERYISDIGEIRRIALEDGSTMLLNTATEVAVKFNERQRNIRLIRGEALFEVAHDKARPFVVRANDTAVHAVGTAFVVRLEETRVEVTVTEGVVEVAGLAMAPASDQGVRLAAQPQTKRVAANERLVSTHAHAAKIQTIAPAESDRHLAWREGMVSFGGESLQTAVSEINRHNRRQIVIDDQSLASRPVVGIFRATDLDGFAAAAAAALHARAIHDGEVIRLEPGASETPN